MERLKQSILNYGLFRHGETIWNSEKRVQGHGDSPLTAKGVSSLRGWASYLALENWQHILCSDLGRVRRSVAILNEVLNLPVTIDRDLREQDWGEWEGMKVRDVYDQYPEELARQSRLGWDFRPPGGESRKEVRNRFFQALTNHRRHTQANNILVVCHLGVIKCAIYSVANRKFLQDESPLLENGTMHTITFDGEYNLNRLNIALEQAQQ